jgi:DNA-binding GntR family transcriptional regulator
MPKKYGVKEKDKVVAHIVNLALTGKLRTGDRIDRNEIAEDVGVSRVPVQTAVVQLEDDGSYPPAITGAPSSSGSMNPPF